MSIPALDLGWAACNIAGTRMTDSPLERARDYLGVKPSFRLYIQYLSKNRTQVFTSFIYISRR